jgi:hypothetical protein
LGILGIFEVILGIIGRFWALSAILGAFWGHAEIFWDFSALYLLVLGASVGIFGHNPSITG